MAETARFARTLYDFGKAFVELCEGRITLDDFLQRALAVVNSDVSAVLRELFPNSEGFHSLLRQEYEPLLTELRNEIQGVSLEYNACFPSWRDVRVLSIQKLQEVALFLHSSKGITNKVRLTGAGTGFLSGALTIGGILLAPVTAGASTAVAVGAAGAIIGCTVSVGGKGMEYMIEKKKCEEIRQILQRDIRQTETMAQMLSRFERIAQLINELGTKLANQHSLIINAPYSDQYNVAARAAILFPLSMWVLNPANYSFSHNQRHSLTDGVKECASAGAKEGASLTSRAVGVSLAAASMIIDMIEIGTVGTDILDGSKSAKANSIKTDIIPALEDELRAFTELYEQTRHTRAM